jgi:iron(III) transport system permease protein
MTRWRVLLALVVLGLVGAPAALPFLELAGRAEGWRAWMEAPRLLTLAQNTLGLVGGTLALALPAGIVGAILLYRTDLPLRRPLRFLTLLSLFVPLPLFTSAWQAALGTGGWLPVGLWNTAAAGDPDVAPTGTVWKPWAQGLGAAIWVHAVAALPWVVLLVGQGLLWVERELEEDQLTLVPPWLVFWRVTLPRARAAVLAAATWVALLALTEITVTDMMQVRTFAEEVYTQLVVDLEAVPRAVAVSLPAVVLSWAVVLWATRRWEADLPARQTLDAPPLLYPLGRARGPLLVLVLGAVVILAGVPLASLIWKAGLAGRPQAWSAAVAGHHLAITFRVRGTLVVESFVESAVAGALIAGLGWLVCWLAVGSRWFRIGAFGLAAALWALPAPVIGLGLKEAIGRLMQLLPFPALAEALYYGPSPLPVLWADLVRFFPFALALLWPVVRLVPQELRDAARVAGARPLQEFRWVVAPVTRAAYLRAALAVAVLSLGELGAGKIVETPGSQTFAHEVFTQMHYGVSNDLAALCLVLLALVLIGGGLVGLLARRTNEAGPR